VHCNSKMSRPTIKGSKKKRKKYKRVRVAYRHKPDLYGSLTGNERRSKHQLISKWRANEAKITVACNNSRSSHLNFRERGMTTDGAPVSRTLLKLKGKNVAAHSRLDDTQFSASVLWMHFDAPPQAFSAVENASRVRPSRQTQQNFRQLFKRIVLKCLAPIKPPGFSSKSQLKQSLIKASRCGFVVVIKIKGEQLQCYLESGMESNTTILFSSKYISPKNEKKTRKSKFRNESEHEFGVKKRFPGQITQQNLGKQDNLVG
ncbi:hypothetical protein GN958_ATG18461, partial [Phytophthora infestans]